jgi:hypothetical protein
MSGAGMASVVVRGGGRHRGPRHSGKRVDDLP